MQTRILTFFTLICAAIASVQSAHPAIISVTNGNDSGAGSLRQALINANDGDTIQFTFTQGMQVTLSSGELVVNKSVVITSLNVTIPVTVTRMTAAPPFRIFHITPGKTVSMSGLIITNGVSTADASLHGGGGILNEASTLTINNCVVSGNSSLSVAGGGICNGIMGPTSGSAILTINNSTISGNTAKWGGGIAVGTPRFASAAPSSTITINNSTITGNSATGNLFAGSGGGIFSFTAGRGTRLTLTINNCTLSGNSATTINHSNLGDGGGIYTLTGNPVSTTVVSNSTLSGNSASNRGGGIYDAARCEIFNTTLSGNSASNGASLYSQPYSRMGNTILKSSGANIAGHITSLGYNLCNDNGNGDLTAPGDQTNTDPMLGPLQNNGGPTLTHAPLTGSPAIDRGNPRFTPPPSFDQRGTGFPRVVNGRLDIGAVEVQ